MWYGLIHFLLLVIALTVVVFSLDSCKVTGMRLGIALFLIWGLVAVFH